MILHTTAYGPSTGDPILAIHGLGAYGRRFRRLAEEGLPSRRVLAVDLRGHGGSGWDPPWHIERHVADLVETLDALGVVRSDVIAHSFGACVAMQLAVASPGRVRDLALLDPAIGLDPALVLEGIEEQLVDESWTSPEEALSARVAGQPPQALWGYEEDVAVRLVRDPDGRFRFPHSRGAAISAWSDLARPLPALDGLAGRVLLVAGRRSAFVGATQRSWFEVQLGDRLTIEDLDCGHMVYWEAFDDTARALSRFLGGPAAISPSAE